MAIRVKRVYDAPAPQDGARILVDRLWPRGLTKQAAALDGWDKALAPSDALRKWVHAHPDAWDEFRSRYRAELETPEGRAALTALRRMGKDGAVTLLFAARTNERNNATVLAEILAET
jgi:uncharacterized protein YeaO (DUF488 family)